MARRFWLVKSEPSVFSWDDLERSPEATTGWEGVRNYQARNLLRDEVQVGDGVLFYHSREPPMAVVGEAVVTRAAYPDPTQLDPASPYHDPEATAAAPRWYAVDIRAEARFSQPVTLAMMRAAPELAEMMVLRRGARLSVQPVSAAEWRVVRRLGGQRGEGRPAGIAPLKGR